jgi:hypothetical protein
MVIAELKRILNGQMQIIKSMLPGASDNSVAFAVQKHFEVKIKVLHKPIPPAGFSKSILLHARNFKPDMSCDFAPSMLK